MVNYFYDCYQILNKIYSEKAFLKQAINSTVIEQKNRALTVKTCYGVLDKDIELSYFITKLAQKSPKLVIRTILKISMYAIKYLAKKEYAVTKSAVELTKKLGKGGMAGFVNAFLRKFISTKIDLPKDEIKKLSVKYSYPEFALEDLIKNYGIARAEEIIKAENPYVCLSFYGCDGKNYLESIKADYIDSPFNNVFFVKNFVRNEDFDKGVYTYQAIGSVAICEIVEAGENLLDCCAAPGGKSIRLSHKFSKVIATDIHEHRVELINDYKRRMRVDNVVATCGDSKVYNPEYLEKFDAVLCDVPCSGLGVINDNPDIKLNRKKESVYELNFEQKEIINNVSKYVKKGGYLYYSTCSVLASENQEIVRNFLASNDNFEIVRITSPLSSVDTGFGLQFLPDISFGLGFFVSKLKRVK